MGNIKNHPCRECDHCGRTDDGIVVCTLWRYYPDAKFIEAWGCSYKVKKYFDLFEDFEEKGEEDDNTNDSKKD